MGVLTEERAALDDALARGYAQGLEEARAETMDCLQTVLVSLLEQRFGDLEESAIDQIAEASAEQLQRWILGVLEATSPRDLLARTIPAE
jgi:flagellar biosynthesis/type III secretory pathway protein FliH